MELFAAKLKRAFEIMLDKLALESAFSHGYDAEGKNYIIDEYCADSMNRLHGLHRGARPEPEGNRRDHTGG